LRWLIEQEWAKTADDVLWRRSKLGLRMTPAQVRELGEYLAANARCGATNRQSQERR